MEVMPSTTGVDPLLEADAATVSSDSATLNNNSAVAAPQYNGDRLPQLVAHFGKVLVVLAGRHVILEQLVLMTECFVVAALLYIRIR